MDFETDTLWKVLLGVGSLSLAGGVAAAYTAPARQYELSIYAATPVAFWIGLAAATLVAIGAALFARREPIRVLGLILGGGCFTAFVGLPVLRNYYFYGTADALTHLGWTSGVVTGEKGLLSLLYPGIHTMGSFYGVTTGFSLARSLQYVVVIFALLFVVGVALCVWALTGDLRTTAVGLFSGAMLLPVTNISSQLVAHPTTQAVMFLPVVLFLLIRYLQSERAGYGPTAVGLLLSVALVAFVFYHPQQALNLLGMFAAIAGLQLLLRWWRSTGTRLTSMRPIYAQTGILAGALLLWAPGHSRFGTSASNSILRIRRLVQGEARVAEETAQRGASLSEIGSSLLEVYLKLFGVATLYCLVAGALLLLIVARRYDHEDTPLASFGRLQAVGLIPVFGIFLLYMVGSFGTQSFRHFAFIMVIVTLLGAIGLARATAAVGARIAVPGARPLAVVVFLLVIAVSVATVFPSPWIYLHSQHVTEGQMNGYETSFEHTSDEAPFYGVRNGPFRYADVHNKGVTDKSRFGALNESAMLTNLSGTYGEDWYFALTRLDRRQEIGAYRGLRYSRESFETAQRQRGVNRVVDNGEFELYYVSG